MSPSRATFFDLNDHALIELAGRDAREFLHNLCTQDVKSLPVGESREAFFTNSKARVIAHVWIWHRAQDVLLLDCAAFQAEKLLQHLNHYLISEQVEIKRRPDFSLLRVVGPNAKAVAASTGLRQIRVNSLPGHESVDLLLTDADGEAIELRQRILENGAVKGDPATYNVLRIEAGLPEYGIDIDENRLAMEVNRTAQAISYAKGCYLGQETIVMARDRGQVNRLLLGIRVAMGDPLTPGAKLFRANEEVGHVTSSVFSPRLNQVVALAYLRRGNWEPGVELTIEPSTDGRSMVVSALPFCSGAGVAVA